MDVVPAAAELRDEVERLDLDGAAAYVYNPLRYAWPMHAAYLRRFARLSPEVLMVGMNPGPWGMAQTGVPFGEVHAVRDWMGLDEEVRRPPDEHPDRPVLGLGCERSEVSGRRLWGWARRRFGTPESFFDRFFVANYCPLLFLADTGRNVTPDRIPATHRRPLLEVCDRALRSTVRSLAPTLVVGIGSWAAERARSCLDGTGVTVHRILHPSPASPAANRGWDAAATAQLEELGVHVPAGATVASHDRPEREA